MTELNAKEILKKYEKTNKIIMRIVDKQFRCEEINEIRKEIPTIGIFYFGVISRINSYVVSSKRRIKETETEINSKENDLIKLVYSESIPKKIKNCFLAFKDYQKDRLLPEKKKESMDFLFSSTSDLYGEVEKIPEFKKTVLK